MPVYNEAGGIRDVLRDVRATFPTTEVIVVDDGSTDGTNDILASMTPGIRLERLSRNHGYGFAIKRGVTLARTEYIAIMDGDGQHRASDLLELCRRAPGLDMVIGTRGRDSAAPLLRRPGKLFLKWLAEYLTGTRIPDLNSGLRVFRRNLIRRYFTVCPDSFSFSTTSTIALLKDRAEVVFHPIKVLPRVGTSTVSIGHGIDTIILLFRLIMLFDPLKIFLTISFWNALVAIAWASREYFLYHAFGASSIVLFLSCLIFFLLGLLADQIAFLRRAQIANFEVERDQ
jgi:glycosyltransferase involved in cell wall biosynthesis